MGYTNSCVLLNGDSIIINTSTNEIFIGKKDNFESLEFICNLDGNHETGPCFIYQSEHSEDLVMFYKLGNYYLIN